MEKSAEAFRTISEVAEILDTPAHVLRFWESRFPQIRPVKRAGGRRYYRPADVALLAGIRRLLHDEGMTIRGVQKILREQGVRHVASLSGTDPGPDPESFPDPGANPGEGDFQAGFTYEEVPEPPRGEVVPFTREAPRPPAPVMFDPPAALRPTHAPASAPVATEPAYGAPTATEPADGATPPPTDLPAASAASDPTTQVSGPATQGAAPMPAAAQARMTARAPTAESSGDLPPADTQTTDDHETRPAGLESPSVPESFDLDPVIWTPALLRALPHRSLAHRQEDLVALRELLRDLRDRLSAAGTELRG